MKQKPLMTAWMFELGAKVKDTVTDFEGTITSRIEYLNGCIQYCVEPKLDKDGKARKHQYIDEGQLELIQKKAKKTAKKDKEGPGGRMPNEPE